MNNSLEKEFEDLILQYGEAEVFPVVTRFPADLITPFGAYLKLAGDAEYSFLFESVEGGESLARYSFLGANPEFVVKEHNQNVNIIKGSNYTFREESIYEFLKVYLKKRKIADAQNLPSFIGGAIGYFDFAAVEYFEPILKKSKKNFESKSQSQFAFYKTTIAFDHAKQQIAIITLVFAEDFQNKKELSENLNSAKQTNEKIFENLGTAEFPQISQNEIKSNSESSSNWEKEDFKNAVSHIKKLINAGECYQVVLSQCFTKKTNASPEAIYRALRSLNPSPYMILMKLSEKSIVGASPEMLVRCRDKKLEYRPIAGTRPRGKNELEDAKFAEEMRADLKEVSEHTMLVDLGRNDLGKVSEFGSVKVKDLMSVEKFSHVQHLVSYLFSDLKKDFDQFDALASCFPAGTVTGAPKVRAIQIIQELEPTARGIYAGAVGYIDYAGNLDTCIAIRTLVLENGVAKIQAGAGIVADSVPETEYQETIHKAKGLFKAIELAESGKYAV
ncbi:MAG: anthranilate synthase component I family protein [Acidobacteriota bacterium]|nr:anthranilate synthase component I family protein [Acidobacteriota bacterium]